MIANIVFVDYFRFIDVFAWQVEFRNFYSRQMLNYVRLHQGTDLSIHYMFSVGSYIRSNFKLKMLSYQQRRIRGKLDRSSVIKQYLSIYATRPRTHVVATPQTQDWSMQKFLVYNLISDILFVFRICNRSQSDHIIFFFFGVLASVPLRTNSTSIIFSLA